MRWFGTARRSARPALPGEVAAALQDGERVLAIAKLAQTQVLVATRFGLWWAEEGRARPGDDAKPVLADEGGRTVRPPPDEGESQASGAEPATRPPVRWDWHRISRAGFVGGALTLTLAQQIDLPAVGSSGARPPGTGPTVTEDRTVGEDGRWPAGLEILVDLPPRTFRLAGTSPLTDAVHARVRGSVVASQYLPFPGAGGWLVWRRVAGRDGLTPQLRLDRGADPGAAGFRAAVAAGLEALRAGAEPRPAE